MKAVLKRGEIYFANLSPVQGSEQGGVRPVLVIQNDMGNAHSPTVIVLCMTSRLKKRSLPTHVLLEHDQTGLERDSMALCEQVRTIDRSRLISRAGEIGAADMRRVEAALRHSAGLE